MKHFKITNKLIFSLVSSQTVLIFSHFLLIMNKSFCYLSDFLPSVRGDFGNYVFEWYFPYDYCQSRFLGRKTESTACTLIVLFMAEYIETNKDYFSLEEVLNPNMVSWLLNSIIDGNHLLEIESERSVAQRKLLFNVFCALNLCKSSLRELKIFYSTERKTLKDVLRSDLLEAITKWDKLNKFHIGINRRK